MTPNVRIATCNDEARVLDLVRACHAHEGIEHDEARTARAIGPLLEPGDAGRLWLICPEGEPIGYVALCFGYSIEMGGRDAFLDEMYIAPAWRGHGLAHAALETVKTQAAALGVQAIHLEVDRGNAQARTLYGKLGFGMRERYVLMSQRLRESEPRPAAATPAPVTVTWLEMRSPGLLRPKRIDDPAFCVEEATERQWQVNRFFYLAVGTQWAWNDKRAWTEDQWRAYVADANLHTYIARHGGSPAGYFELRADGEDGVEIAYFGLLPAFLGRGLGGALLTEAIERAWARAASRVWVHTCTLDHPGALPNYRARGMTVYKEETK